MPYQVVFLQNGCLVAQKMLKTFGTTVIAGALGGFLYCEVKYNPESVLYTHLAIPLLHKLDPENAHNISLWFLRKGIFPRATNTEDEKMLQICLWNRKFSNCIGLAAGFDKNASVTCQLFDMGFGFVEIGSVLPKEQAGNAKPRVFRLAPQSVINRMGFNSDGATVVEARLQKMCKSQHNTLGINLGKNKTSESDEQTIEDYKHGWDRFAKYADYITINISSPNTPNLRDMQQSSKLYQLLQQLSMARESSAHKPPLLVKIAPDLNKQQLEEIAACCKQFNIDGIIVSNTTIQRPTILGTQVHATEQGGLSGAALRPLALETLKQMYKLVHGSNIRLIGVGGISTGEDAYERICHGASLVQIYTAMIYQGPAVLPRIKRELKECLKRDGFTSVEQAVGSKALVKE